MPADAPTIRAGLDSAAVNDTVLVSCGSYFERDLVMKSGITLRSETGDPACVTIDAGRLGRVLDANNLHPRAFIEGLTLTGGKTPDGWIEAMGGGVRCLDTELTVRRCVFIGNSARLGGGLSALRSTVEVTSCEFVANAAEHHDWAAGGGMWCRESSGSLEGCTFTQNTAFSTNSTNPGDGGGLFCNRTTLGVSDCLFDGNSTGAGAGGFYSVTADAAVLTNCRFEGNSARWGGAIYFEFGSTASLHGCTFLRNRALAGGALQIDANSTPTLNDCVFEENQATQGAGGAALCWPSAPNFVRCTFRGNTSTSGGGALYLGGADPRLEQCLFVGNSAGANGGAVRVQSGAVQILGCTLVGNAAPAGAGIHCQGSATAAVERSIIAFSTLGSGASCSVASAFDFACTDIFGNAGGDWVGMITDQLDQNGNMAADPLFCAAGDGNYQIDAGSPCAPAAGRACDLIGALGVGCAVTSVLEGSPAPKATLTSVRNSPNPFNPRTTIRFELAGRAHATLDIYAADGRFVRRLLDADLSAGTHLVVWDGRDKRGIAVASGTYCYRVQAGAEVLARKLSVTR